MQRSRWGWGYTGQTDALKETVKRAARFFGPLDIRDAVPDDALILPSPRVQVPQALQDIADASVLARARFTWGKSYCDRVRGFYGDYSAAPDFVVHPHTEADVQRVLAVCG